jgi:hypothetical protein
VGKMPHQSMVLKNALHEATAERNGKFHLSSNENIFTIARMETFIICFIRHQNTENRSILTNFFSELKQNNIPCSKIIKI